MAQVCPNCGYRPDTDTLNVLEILAYLERSNGKATTRALAMKASVSDSTALRWLQTLEHSRMVKRVGKKAGWKLAS